MTAQPASTGQQSSHHVDDADANNDTRARILSTARDLFLSRGYAGTSTSAIGKAIGISAPALYWHFPSKEAVLFTLIEERLTAFARIVDSQHAAPVQRLADLVRKYVLTQLSASTDAAGYASLVGMAEAAHLLTPEHQDTLRTMQRVTYERFSTTLRDGDTAGDFTLADTSATAFAIIAMCEHVNEWVRPGGRLDPEAVAEEYVVLAWRMAGARTDIAEV
ncbi:TetR/AcrR family transcriptional regulator [Streptomyces antnestii]|uniref:TetR/AcrR family transcriptional regulator n=1 Tax=Streptomyces antnestii TaxID=2494256 RepID=A0A437Q3C0_9ACTN|nr:TetR/AcrR family transcriptional regulator [Streptomyces sp. San01]RVU29019.1 TetR/AcrR family transcriptional regulator [Streptomyces sp. San01]